MFPYDYFIVKKRLLLLSKISILPTLIIYYELGTITLFKMRLGFEVDYDRIIFSSEFRSLQVKTQVIPLPQTIDFSDKLLYVRLLNVNHFVASLSDSHAILSYKKLLGLKFDQTYS